MTIKIQHVDIQSADAHEPKHITDAVMADAGKVITPSDTEDGKSELRKLDVAELTDSSSILNKVTSVFGRTGDVVKQQGDYGPEDIGTNVQGTQLTALANLSEAGVHVQVNTGAPAIAKGPAGSVLTSNGVGAVPTFQFAAAYGLKLPFQDQTPDEIFVYTAAVASSALPVSPAPPDYAMAMTLDKGWMIKLPTLGWSPVPVDDSANLSLKEDKANKGIANGYAPLGSDGKLPDSVIPTSVLALRQDLADPDKGAAMVARGVVAVDSIADLLALLEGQRKEDLRYLVRGYHAGSDVGGGEFYWDAALTAADNGGTVFAVAGVAAGRFVRRFDGPVDVTWFGAAGDGVADDTLAIQSAIEAYNSVYFPFTEEGYRTTAPIYLTTGKSIFGDRGRQVSIFKSTNILGSGSNVIGGQTDSYAKDAVIIVTHPDNSYATYVNISNLNITGQANNEYGIYAPRMYVGGFDNVNLSMPGGRYGFVTHDTFMFSMTDLQVAGNNANPADSVGMWWDDQGDGSSGTSVNFTRCWVRDGWATAYKFRGLVYSTLSSCGADRYINTALDADLCDFTVINFGLENRVSPGASPLRLRYSRINLSSLVAFSVNIASGQFLVDAQGGTYNISGLRHTGSSSPSSGRAYRVADQAVMKVSGAVLSPNLADLTPSVDTSSTFIQADQNYIIGANNDINPYNGRFLVSGADGAVLGYLSSVFGSATQLRSEGALYFGSQGLLSLYHTPSEFRPYENDNASSLGSAGQRWTQVYATTGSINTSDEREKQQVTSLDAAEIAAAIDLKGMIRKFKWNHAVEEKGGDARWHVGVMAQEVKSVFESHGLDAGDYGMFCYDEWPEQEEIVESWGDEYDKEGNLVRAGGSKVVQEYRPSGNRYGVRYDQLLAFVIAAL